MPEILTYEADGLAMRSELFLPPGGGGPRPGVLVFPAIFGLSDHARERARRLAEELGYAALACDLHGEARLLSGLEEAREVMAPVREHPERIRERARAALQVLTARPEVDVARVGAIGFCFGGGMALELARSGAELRGVVGFHNTLATKIPAKPGDIRGKVLVCIGADDPGVPAEQRAGFEAEMRAAGVNWQMNVYGGVVHSFTEPEADKLGRPEMARYDPQADRRSWAEMRAFFEEVFA